MPPCGRVGAVNPSSVIPSSVFFEAIGTTAAEPGSSRSPTCSRNRSSTPGSAGLPTGPPGAAPDDTVRRVDAGPAVGIGRDDREPVQTHDVVALRLLHRAEGLPGRGEAVVSDDDELGHPWSPEGAAEGCRRELGCTGSGRAEVRSTIRHVHPKRTCPRVGGPAAVRGPVRRRAVPEATRGGAHARDRAEGIADGRPGTAPRCRQRTREPGAGASPAPSRPLGLRRTAVAAGPPGVLMPVRTRTDRISEAMHHHDGGGMRMRS